LWLYFVPLEGLVTLLFLYFLSLTKDKLMEETNMDEIIGFRINEPLRRAAEQRANATDQSLSSYIRYLITKDVIQNKQGEI
jgi:predicted HicB family RNase H-like nuclease